MNLKINKKLRKYKIWLACAVFKNWISFLFDLYNRVDDFSVLTDRSVKSKQRRTNGRAVFTTVQKDWLEYYFQIEKYITKQNRKKLASTLGLTDLQVSWIVLFKK